MLRPSDIKSLSTLINFTLYLYKKDEDNIVMYNNSTSKSTAIPIFFKDMIAKSQYRKVIEKNGVKIVYHYFKLDNDYILFFQDSLDDSRLVELIEISSTLASNSNNNSNNISVVDTINIDTTETAEYKKELITAKSDQAKLRQELRKRDTVLAQYSAKLEYLANDIIVMQNLMREQNTTITSLKSTSTEYYAQIKKLSTGVDMSNFNKLKQVNNTLRHDLTKANFTAKTVEDIATKLKRNSTKATQEITRIIKDNDEINKSDLEIILGILMQNEALSIKVNNKYIADESDHPNIKLAINVINDAIKNNNASEINLYLLAEIISIDPEETKANPATVLEAVMNTLLAMVKARRFTQKQLDILFAATNIKNN